MRTYSPNLILQLSHYWYQNQYKRLQTFELDGAQDQSLAFMIRPHISDDTLVAAKAAARFVSVWTYQDFALNIHWLCGSQELEGLKCESGISLGASGVGSVGTVFWTSKGKNNKRCYWTNTWRLKEQRGPVSSKHSFRGGHLAVIGSKHSD